MTLAVGDKLFYVGNEGVGNRMRGTVTVKSVGRKWAQLEGNFGKIHKTEWWEDGGDYTSPAQCYASETAFLQKMEVARAFNELRQRIGYLPNEGVDIDDIMAAANALGIKIPDAPTE